MSRVMGDFSSEAKRLEIRAEKDPCATCPTTMTSGIMSDSPIMPWKSS